MTTRVTMKFQLILRVRWGSAEFRPRHISRLRRWVWHALSPIHYGKVGIIGKKKARDFRAFLVFMLGSLPLTPLFPKEEK